MKQFLKEFHYHPLWADGFAVGRISFEKKPMESARVYKHQPPCANCGCTNTQGPTEIPKIAKDIFLVKTAEKMSPKITVRVYLDNGLIYKYHVDTPAQAREHAHAIVMTGYRHTDNTTGELVHFPPSRILKVKCKGPGITTNYPDEIEGT